jgi:hypothetical protein
MPLVKMPENSNWDTDINVPDTGDNAYGGINGNMFVGLKSLVNRVLWLKDALNSLSSKVSGTNTGDETAATIKTKLGITTLSGTNTGDETATTIANKLGITTLSGANTGDETAATIKSKLGVTALIAGVRLGTVSHYLTSGATGFYDTSGYVLTGASSSQSNSVIDVVWARPLQITFDNTTWYNVTSI